VYNEYYQGEGYLADEPQSSLVGSLSQTCSGCFAKHVNPKDYVCRTDTTREKGIYQMGNGYL
jgi:hypothetical protein